MARRSTIKIERGCGGGDAHLKSKECFEVYIAMEHVGVMDTSHTIIVALKF